MKQKHSKIVKKRFDSEFESYDKKIRDILPYYEKMQSEVIKLVKFEQDARLKILDLGIGTGQTAFELLQKFPHSYVDGIDLSKKMMDIAKSRLRQFSQRVNFIESDMIDFKPKQKYDVCIAVLSVHHLNSMQKQEMFVKIFNNLKPNGIFVIGDLIIGNSKGETNRLEKMWKKYLIKTFGRDKAKKLFDDPHKEEDIPDSIDNQLKWLKESGFKWVECKWKKINCAVLFGKKVLFIK